MEEVPELEEGVKEEEGEEAEGEEEEEADLPEYPESFPAVQAPVILDLEPEERIANITIELTDDSQPPQEDSIPNAQPDPPMTPARKETAACFLPICVTPGSSGSIKTQRHAGVAAVGRVPRCHRCAVVLRGWGGRESGAEVTLRA